MINGKMTNGGYIKFFCNMRALSRFLRDITSCDKCPAKDTCNDIVIRGEYLSCDDAIYDWLLTERRL